MYLTALDFGSNQIKAIVAQINNKGRVFLVDVFKYPSAGIRKGEIINAEEAAASLRRLFAEISGIDKQAVKNILLNVNGQNIRLHNSKGIVAVSRADNEIYQDDVERVIKASQAINLPSNHHILHTIVQEYVIDSADRIQNPLGMAGNRLEANTLIVDAFAPSISGLSRAVELAGGKIREKIYDPLAASHAALSKNRQELGAVLIDIGFGTTSMGVFEEDKLIAAKVFPVGAGHVTNDLAVALKSTVETAEKIKLAYGCAMSREVSGRDKIILEEVDPELKGEISRRFVADIIEMRLAEIFSLVNDELKTIGKTKLPGGAVLCGGGAKMDKITEPAKKELKLPVHLYMPETGIFEHCDSDLVEKLEEPEYAVATGLLAYEFGEFMKNRGQFQMTNNKFLEIVKRFLP